MEVLPERVPYKNNYYSGLHKANDIVKRIDKGVSGGIEEFVKQVQLTQREGKDTLGEAEINMLKQNIDSWNEVLRQKIQ
jgi:hypothetical protein